MRKDLYLLSEKFYQDRLENCFGKLGQCGGRNENPGVKQCIDNAANMRVQGSAQLQPRRGNGRERPHHIDEEKIITDSTPMPKRRKDRKKL